MSNPTLQETAYHEAGHALAFWLLTNKSPSLISIKPEHETRGRVAHDFLLYGVDVEFNVSEEITRKIKAEILVALAGHAAQRLFNSSLPDDREEGEEDFPGSDWIN